jgi:hypothetical protein
MAGAGADGVAFDPHQTLASAFARESGTLSVIEFTGGKAVLIDTIKTKASTCAIVSNERTGCVRMLCPTLVSPALP